MNHDKQWPDDGTFRGKVYKHNTTDNTTAKRYHHHVPDLKNEVLRFKKRNNSKNEQ